MQISVLGRQIDHGLRGVDMNDGDRQVIWICDKISVLIQPALGDGYLSLVRPCVGNAEAVGVEAALPVGGASSSAR